MYTIPGSGNYLIDIYEQEEHIRERAERSRRREDEELDKNTEE